MTCSYRIILTVEFEAEMGRLLSHKFGLCHSELKLSLTEKLTTVLCAQCSKSNRYQGVSAFCFEEKKKCAAHPSLQYPHLLQSEKRHAYVFCKVLVELEWGLLEKATCSCEEKVVVWEEHRVPTPNER